MNGAGGGGGGGGGSKKNKMRSGSEGDTERERCGKEAQQLISTLKHIRQGKETKKHRQTSY